MTTITIEDRIEKAIDNLISQDKMFTLLDISQAVKKDGGEWMSHTVMKPIIEHVLGSSFVTVGHYTESLIQVDTPVGYTQARLFHPYSSDPAQYSNRAQVASPPKQLKQTKVKTPPAGHPTVTGRKVIKDRSAQAQGYAEVPKKVWQKAGFKPGDDVVITTHAESLTIYRYTPKAKHYAKCKKYLAGTLKTKGLPAVMPMAGRFRVSPNHLNMANLSSVKLDFSAFTDKIVVSKKF